MNQPTCFVIMPFGRKTDASGALVDFDAVYRKIIRPAVEEVGLRVIRGDEELTGTVLQREIIDKLIRCEYAVADLTTENPSVYYELGVRHAARPGFTVLLKAQGSRLPFDLMAMPVILYGLGPEGNPIDVEVARAALVKSLRQPLLDPPIDSPVYTFLERARSAAPAPPEPEDFHAVAQRNAEQRERITAARRDGSVDALRSLEADLGDIAVVDSSVVMDLFLSYRALSAWGAMIDLAARMAPALAETVKVQEQLAMALNRNGQGERAELVLQELIRKQGPSSETLGILGRVYKDRWETALKDKDTLLARAMLEKAIDAYKRGFEADWRDYYPGMNAVTLMEVRGQPQDGRELLIPIVSYAVERRIASGKPEFWDYATMVELAVLGKDETAAHSALAAARDAAGSEPWKCESLARNLQLIHEARAARGESLPWVEAIIQGLQTLITP
jgi:hypothetical protein